MTTAIRMQLLAIGARQALAPVLDVARDPRWGRMEETFGEDPTLVSHFGVAYVRGLQGNELAQGVMATGKHFIGHSLSQGGMNCAPVHMGLREVYDIYLGPFQAAIRDAGLASIMNAYPELDGEVVAASRRILTELLREQLGFDGLVVSDYEAVQMINTFHYLAADQRTAARLALEAGIDVELPTTVCYGEPLKAALEAGDLALETVDLAVRRHLQKKLELGLFENPYVDEGHVLEVYETAENRALARQIARQSMVLLKNDGLLPLNRPDMTLAVIGPNADAGRNQLGDYSYAATLDLMAFQAPAEFGLCRPRPRPTGAARNSHRLGAGRLTGRRRPRDEDPLRQGLRHAGGRPVGLRASGGNGAASRRRAPGAGRPVRPDPQLLDGRNPRQRRFAPARRAGRAGAGSSGDRQAGGGGVDQRPPLRHTLAGGKRQRHPGSLAARRRGRRGSGGGRLWRRQPGRQAAALPSRARSANCRCSTTTNPRGVVRTGTAITWPNRPPRCTPLGTA